MIYDDRSYDEFDAAFTRAIRSNARFDNQIQLSQHKSFDVQESRKIPYSRGQSAGKSNHGKRSNDDNDDKKVPKTQNRPKMSKNKIVISISLKGLTLKQHVYFECIVKFHNVRR